MICDLRLVLGRTNLIPRAPELPPIPRCLFVFFFLNTSVDGDSNSSVAAYAGDRNPSSVALECIPASLQPTELDVSEAAKRLFPRDRNRLAGAILTPRHDVAPSWELGDSQ